MGRNWQTNVTFTGIKSNQTNSKIRSKLIKESGSSGGAWCCICGKLVTYTHQTISLIDKLVILYMGLAMILKTNTYLCLIKNHLII